MTPQWLASAGNGNAVVGGTPNGSAVTKTSGSDSVYNATARTRDRLTGVGSFSFAIDVGQYALIGLTSSTESADLIAANFPYAISVGGGFALVLHAGGYAGDLFPTADSGVHTITIEVFDSGGGVLKVRYLVDSVVKFTESSAIAGLPLALGLNIATLGTAITSIAGTSTSLDNTAPVVNAGTDQNILSGETATLAGSATDDGLPSGTVTYTWSKVSGPGTVTFGNASLASTTATFSALGAYVLRLTATDGSLTGTDDLAVTVTAAPSKPVAPVTYDLDASTTPRSLPAAPLPLLAAGSTITDPRFGTPVTRVTDATTGGGQSFGTSSAAATNGWASDDSAFLAVGEESLYIIYNFDPVSGVYERAESFIAGIEPTFSRSIARPHILYGCTSSNDLKIKTWNRLTQAWSLLWDVRDDVPTLTPGGNSQFLGGIYNSEDSPERIIFAYGATQETHPYVTILEVENPANRVTLNVAAAQVKINGGAWQQLVRHTGANSAISVGMHSTAIDRTGKWAQLLYSGNNGGARKGAFFNMATSRIHEYDADKWFGHSSLGKRTHVTFASGLAVPPQWDLTDLEQGGVFPTGGLLINPAPNPGDWFLQDHNNWNNCRQDGTPTPFITGIQVKRSGIGGPTADQASNLVNWAALWDELAMISTDPAAVQGTDMWWRICHHYNALVNAIGQYVGTFRDSPRPQVSHGGLWANFSSNWGLTLGTRGTARRDIATGLDDPNGAILINHRRDLFLVRLSRTTLEAPPPPPLEVEVDDEVEEVSLVLGDAELASQDEELIVSDTSEIHLVKGVTVADRTIYRGARKTFVFTLAGTGNLDGWTIAATVRARDKNNHPTGPTVKVIPGTVTDSAARKFAITFTETDSAIGTEPEEQFAWDVWRTNVGGKQPLMPPSTLTVLGSVTNL